MVTIKDIAEKTGYSKATVSRVLNHHPYVSDEVRQKIQAVIDELNYAPNLVTKELSAGRTNKIAVVVPHNRHPYFTQLLNGLLNESSRTDHNLLLLHSDYNESLEKEYLEQLRGHAFDGLIFTSRSIDLKTIETYSQYGPVLLCEPVQSSLVQSVYIDRYQAYKDLNDYLKDRGIVSPAYLFTRTDEVSSTYRCMMTVLDDHFPAYRSSPTYDRISTFQEGYDWALVHGLIHDFDAIVTNEDQVAYGLMRKMAELCH